MKKATIYFLTAVLLILTNLASAQVTKAPAYPLINHNPYFSIWSFSDQLNQSTTKHWTGSPNSILGLINTEYGIKKRYPEKTIFLWYVRLRDQETP